MDDLRGKRALVVGGSSGIGLALAKGFAGAGARVAIAARTEAKVRAAEEALQRIDPETTGHMADVTSVAEIEKLRDAVAERHGVPDILVNSQGTTVIAPSHAVTEKDYDTVMNTNLRSVLFCCTVFGAQMKARGSGAIINIASLAAHRGWPRAVVYAISKHGILALTRTLAAEWASDGIRVNSISPGFFMTELNRDRMSEERKATARARTPAERFGEME
ncbi:MAG: SDR family oxidoreductase, partial [Pseudomonadota bacterium]